ncbi:hypothetical protein, partial [Streptomyces sp. NPDC059063]
DGYTDGHQERSEPGTGGTGDPEGIAPGEPDPSGATYKPVGELPDGPDSAAVYEPRGEVTKEQVARLAKALGLSGTPTAQGGAWRIGPANDGSGPSLQVARKAPGTWTFSRNVPVSGDNCLKGKPCSTKPTAPDRPHPDDSGDAVSERAAKKAAAPVLKALGQDDAKLDARQLMGSVRVVNADPEVGGLPTYGWSTGIQVDADGKVAGGSGNVLAPHKGATYPVVSAEKALDLLNKQGRGDGRVGIGGCATPVPHADGGRTGTGDGGSGPGKDEGTRCVPEPVPPKPRPIAVEDATFGLASQFVAGRQTLVPSWLFAVKPQGAKDAFTVTHPAVDPKYLTWPGDGVPTPRPTDRPGDPGTRTHQMKIDGYSAEGRDLTVHFTGGVCGTYAVTAEENESLVSVKVTETTKKDTVCVAMAQFYTLKVRLAEPLGDRKVVTTGGKAVPRDKGEVKGEPAPRS